MMHAKITYFPLHRPGNITKMPVFYIIVCGIYKKEHAKFVLNPRAEILTESETR